MNTTIERETYYHNDEVYANKAILTVTIYPDGNTSIELIRRKGNSESTMVIAVESSTVAIRRVLDRCKRFLSAYTCERREIKTS